MITLDYKPFADTSNKYFQNLNRDRKYEIIEIKKAIYDRLRLDESSNINCTSEKLPWDYDTVFLANFQQNLEAGNINLNGLPVNTLRIRRRRKDVLRFETIKEFEFDPDKLTYEFDDRFLEAHEDYVYGIQPLGGSVENPVSGNTIIAEIETDFESVWIMNKDTQFQLKYNLEVGGYEANIPTEIQETLGRKYPIVFSNGNVNYRRGNLSCLILSDSTANTNNINPKEEKQMRRLITNFLTDKKPKFYKDGSGESMVIMIMGSPTLSPRNRYGQLIYDMSVDFVEVAGTDAQDLIKAGLLEVN